jgi:hypothetical protein
VEKFGLIHANLIQGYRLRIWESAQLEMLSTDWPQLKHQQTH